MSMIMEHEFKSRTAKCESALVVGVSQDQTTKRMQHDSRIVDDWNRLGNYRRLHQLLNMKTPAEE